MCGYHRQDGAWVSWLAFQPLTRKKALALDYETAASPAFQSRIATLDQTVRIKGGLSMIPAAYRAVLESALSIATCVALMAALVAAMPAPEAPLALAASPVASAVLLACAVCALVLGQRAVSRASARVTERFSLGDGAMERRMVYLYDAICHGDGKVERVFGMHDMLLGAFRSVNADSTRFYDRWRAGNRHVAMASNAVNGAFVLAGYPPRGGEGDRRGHLRGRLRAVRRRARALGGAWSELVSRNNDLREHCALPRGVPRRARPAGGLRARLHPA